MASNKKILSDVAQNLNLRFIDRACTTNGYYRNYHLLIIGSSFSENKQHVQISFCVKGQYPTEHLYRLLSLPKGSNLQVGTYKTNIYVPISGNHDRNVDMVIGILNHITMVLATNGFMNCDEQGKDGITEIYCIKGQYVFLTSESVENIRRSFNQDKIVESNKKENYLLGILGACGGALLGSIVVFLIARMGYISSIGCVVMGAAIVLGYKWKGVKLSEISAGICILISYIFSYLTFRLDTAVSLCKSERIEFLDAFLHAKDIMPTGISTSYGRNLMFMVGAGILGTVIIACAELASEKEKFEIKKLM